MAGIDSAGGHLYPTSFKRLSILSFNGGPRPGPVLLLENTARIPALPGLFLDLWPLNAVLLRHFLPFFRRKHTKRLTGTKSAHPFFGHFNLSYFFYILVERIGFCLRSMVLGLSRNGILLYIQP